MKSKIGLVTLGVSDVQKAKDFYKGLGFIPKGDDNDDMVMLKAEGTWLGLYPWDLLAEDAQVNNTGQVFVVFPWRIWNLLKKMSTE